MATAAVFIAAMLAPAAPAQAQVFLSAKARQAEPPQDFAWRIARLYESDSPWWKAETPAAGAAFRARVFVELYDPPFAKLINDNRMLAARRFGGADLDYDPVCQCQDEPGELSVQSVTRRGPAMAEARIGTGCAFGAPGCDDYFIELRRIGGGWRIADIRNAGGSVRALLVRHNACLRAPGVVSIDNCKP